MAYCPNRMAGTAFLKVDGMQYRLRGTLTISIDPFERVGMAGADGVHGFNENPRVPFIEAELSDIGGLSIERLQDICDSTVTAELTNGKTYLLRNAWTSVPREVNGIDGSVTVRFEGMAGKEIRP